jgi:hypothetical protein
MAIVVLIAISIFAVFRYGNHLAAQDEQSALPVGLSKMKEECAKEISNTQICDNLTAQVSTGEYKGETSWIVYARSSNDEYRASIIVVKSGSKLQTTQYIRSRQ